MNILSVDKDIELEEYSKLTMSYTVDGFNELKEDIMRNGLRVPIILREGKLLDGRHRYRACMELGIEIRCQELGKITDEKALDVVISNSIHKSTNTDSAKVEAYLMCKAKGVKNKNMSGLFSRLSSNHIKKMVYIEKENPEYLQALLRQNSVRLHNIEFDKLEDYGTINGIWRTLKGNSRFNKEVIEVTQEPTGDFNYGVYIEEVMPTATAEKEFWDVHNMAKSVGSPFSPSSALGKVIIGYIVEKHK